VTTFSGGVTGGGVTGGGVTGGGVTGGGVTGAAGIQPVIIIIATAATKETTIICLNVSFLFT
jgi:hypothetical protein